MGKQNDDAQVRIYLPYSHPAATPRVSEPARARDRGCWKGKIEKWQRGKKEQGKKPLPYSYPRDA